MKLKSSAPIRGGGVGVDMARDRRATSAAKPGVFSGVFTVTG
jgi:hypothetical protein